MIENTTEKEPALRKLKSSITNLLEPVTFRINFNRSLRYIKKHYKNIIEQDIDSKPGIKSNTVWIMWLQGIDNAPELVKQCYSSVKYHLGGQGNEIVLLTDENLSEYVSLPPHITDKYSRGIISMQHYSDIVRTYLLSNYGGLWIDATVLCTGSDFYEMITNNKFFSFQSSMFKNGFSVWFIYSDSNNVIIRKMYNLLIEYWKDHDKLIEYFLIDIAFMLCSEKHPENEWFSIPKYSTNDVKLLQKELLNDYDEDKIDNILKLSDFHKLNWKANSSNPNSVLNMIINGTFPIDKHDK